MNAAGKPQAKTTSTSWRASCRIPVQISAPMLITTFTHDAWGIVLTRAEQPTSDTGGRQAQAAPANGSPSLMPPTNQSSQAVPTALAPVTMPASAPKMYDIHVDHLDTPRVMTDCSSMEVRRWDSAPFEETLANEQPENQAGKFTFNLRFPGQYFYVETGLHYNYFRDYDPASGRYVQSDPIGLLGGLNTYSYVENKPVARIDPEGLQSWSGDVAPKQPKILGFGDVFTPQTQANDAFVDSIYHILNALQLPKTGSCKSSEWDYCYAKCGGPSKTKGCYVSIRWKTRRMLPGTGGVIREEERIVNCNCDCP